MPRVIAQNEPDSLTAPNPTGLVPGVVDIVEADGTISPAGDEDFFRVSVNAGQVITVATDARNVFPNGAGGSLDTVVEIYNSAGTLLTSNDDFDTFDSFLQYSAPTSGDYIVGVRGYLNTSTGLYRVFINNDTQLDVVDFNANAVAGNADPNLLVGGAGADNIQGLGGDDVIHGGTGNDTLSGGLGDDLFVWTDGDGSDSVDGGAGSDTQQVIGSLTLGDTFNLFASGTTAVFTRTNLTPFTIAMTGVETLEVNGGGGDDLFIVGNMTGTDITRIVFDGGTGHDLDTGPTGNDTIDASVSSTPITAFGRDGADTLIGGSGDDLLGGGGGPDVLNGNGGIDTATYAGSGAGVTVDLLLGIGTGGAAAGDTLTNIENLIGSDFNDVLIGSNGDNVIRGGLGDDLIQGNAGIDTLLGGDGNDRLEGGADRDRLEGGNGNDALIGDDGDDQLVGDDGNDQMLGGAGLDLMLGGNGDDRLDGGDGNDRLEGENGFDTLVGGDGIDLLLGGDGNDQIYGDAGGDRLEGGAGIDALAGGDGDDQMVGGTEGDYLFGGNGLDQMLGEDGDDLLSGQGGNDRLDGGAGNDQMYGDDGDDIMIGGLGNDDMNGGAGNDLFVFEGAFGQDRIYGFAPGAGSEDRIQLTGLGFTSYADVLAHTTLGGSGAVINASGNTITLIGVSVSSLSPDDFLV